MRQQSRLAKNWPVVPAHQTVRPGEYRAAPSRQRPARADHVRAESVLQLPFKDSRYTGMHGSFSSNTKTTSRWVPRLFRTDFQDGASVKVWVNPANPSEATLNPRAPFGWLLWLMALGFAGLSYYTAFHG